MKKEAADVPQSVGSDLPVSAGARWLHEQHPEILKFSRVAAYKRKEIIIREAMPSSFVYIMLRGTAICYKTTENGMQMLIILIQPGQLFGFMNLFGRGVQTVTVETLEPCQCLEIDKVQLKHFLLSDPKILWKFTEELGFGVANYAQLVQTHSLTVEQRVYKSLIALGQQFGFKATDGIELRINLTQEMLATCARTTRATAARILSSLTQQGILRVKPKPWRICRLDRLAALLNSGQRSP